LSDVVSLTVSWSLAAARARHGTAAELLDPDGDRNGG
jgi:hypothetical protein